VSPPFPSHYDDDHGRAACGLPLALEQASVPNYGDLSHRHGRRTTAESGAHAYTTPVIYIFFDNLAHRFFAQVEYNGSQRRSPGRVRMNISALFIQRPVATTLLTVAVVLAGAIAFVVLPVAPLPEVDFPTIFRRRRPSGASAAIMDRPSPLRWSGSSVILPV